MGALVQSRGVGAGLNQMECVCLDRIEDLP